MDRTAKHLVTGNDFSMGDSLGFNMSGETDGGLGVAVYYEIDGGALDDYDMTLSGDWGSLKFNGSGSSSALGAVDDVMPNAYEESWDIVTGADTGTRVSGGGGDNMFTYVSPTVSGATVTASYLNASDAVTDKSYSDIAIAYSPEMVEGLSIGYATAEDQINAGVTGPNIRAAGVNTDARWTNPYSVYDQVDWEPAVEKPTSVKGADCYDRYRVRMEEMRQSCRMLLDAIEKIPGGANTHYQPGDEMILTKAPTRAPEGATGFSTYECTRGVSNFYIQGGGDSRGKNPYRLSIRSPMFITIPYVAKTMIGYKVADIPAIMGSFDPCIGETDR